MTQISSTTAPLTRREARAIERRTGTRPIATVPTARDSAVGPRAVRPVACEDTSRIERNDVAALVSVVPTEIIDRIATPGAEAASGDDAFRHTAVRAARPAALVFRSRKRRSTGVAIAASAAALATAGALVPGQFGAVADQQAQANLLGAADQAQAAAPSPAPAESPAGDPTAEAQGVQLTEAPVDVVAVGSTSVATFQPMEVSEIVEAPEPEPEPVVEDAGAEEDVVEEPVVEDSAPPAEAPAEAPAPSYGAGYGAGIVATAESMLGGGAGWLCTDFVSAVLTANGVPHAQGTVSTMAASGTQISSADAQPGDLVVFDSGHIGIYAGGGMMYDNPGFESSHVGWQNVYRSVDVIGSSYSFVRMG